MRELYREQERLSDYIADLEDAVTDVEHLLRLGAIRADDNRRTLYEDELAGLRHDIEDAECELSRIEARIENIDRAEFERMTA